jgi:hypothetical protein
MSIVDMIALGPELTRLLQCGLRAWESAPYREGVSAAIYEAARPWNPVVKGVAILEDDATRRAGADFLAGICCTLKRHNAAVGS